MLHVCEELRMFSPEGHIHVRPFSFHLYFLIVFLTSRHSIRPPPPPPPSLVLAFHSEMYQGMLIKTRLSFHKSDLLILMNNICIQVIPCFRWFSGSLRRWNIILKVINEGTGNACRLETKLSGCLVSVFSNTSSVRDDLFPALTDNF